MMYPFGPYVILASEPGIYTYKKPELFKEESWLGLLVCLHIY